MTMSTQDCCGEPLHWLIAEATDGYRTWTLWRCARCEQVYRTGWKPPTWGNKIAEVCHNLGKALDSAVAAAYGVPDAKDE